MQAIINGKLYDTDEASLICKYSEYSRTSLSGNKTGLYKTEKGNYFFECIHGLESCTKEEAKEFFQENIDGYANTYEEYSAEFGDEIELA